MNKEDIIERYGIEAYEKQLEQKRAWAKANPEKQKAAERKWKEVNPEKIKADSHEQNRKGGKRYAKKLEYQQKGIQGERHKIRHKHGKQYRPFKKIIAPDSQIHHEWVPRTPEYRGVALVEANPHRYGIIDVIEILEGKITLLTEEEVKNGKKNKK